MMSKTFLFCASICLTGNLAHAATSFTRVIGGGRAFNPTSSIADIEKAACDMALKDSIASLLPQVALGELIAVTAWNPNDGGFWDSYAGIFYGLNGAGARSIVVGGQTISISSISAIRVVRKGDEVEVTTRIGDSRRRTVTVNGRYAGLSHDLNQVLLDQHSDISYPKLVDLQGTALFTLIRP